MTPVVAVGGIAFDARGRVLLVQRDRPPGAGRWTVPGGRVEAGEHLVDAVVRELREETGLAVEVGPVVEVLDRIGRSGPDADASLAYHFVIIDYLVRIVGGTLAAGDDARDARFVPFEDLGALPLTEGLEPVLRKARATAVGPGVDPG